MSKSKERPDPDPDEDLFDFASVGGGAESASEPEDLSEVFAAFRDEAPDEQLLELPAAPLPNTPLAATPAATRPLEPVPEPAPARRARREPTPAPAEAASPAPVAPVAHVAPVAAAPRAPRFSRSVVLVALGVTLLNSALAVVVLRARSTVPARAGTSEPVAHAETRATPPPKPTAAPLPDPDALDTLHSHPTIDQARQEISRGEYASARQRVYALLAIIDRLDDPRRSALEADCQFLIAQSLHLEALARMGTPR